METVYHGDVPKKKRRSCQNWLAAWEKSKRNPFIMAIAKPSEIGLAKRFGLAKLFGLVKPWGMAPAVGAIDDERP